MSNPDHLESTLRVWLQSTPNAQAAAQFLISKAAATGTLPAEVTLPAEDDRALALRDLLPEGRYTARRGGGRKVVFRIPAFEHDQGIAPGSILTTIARLTGNTMENRRAQRQNRAQFLTQLIDPFTTSSGFQGEIARRDLADVQAERGRWWSLAGNATETEIAREVERYWNLLARVEKLGTQTGLVRAVHLSREVCGDTHWFRPGTQPWRWVAEDLASLLPDAPRQAGDLQGPEWRQKVLEHCGVCECLTSVRVLLFGNSELVGDGFCWSWPADAASEGMPIWLSMAHLEHATLRAMDSVHHVVTIENETTFWDMLEERDEDGPTLLVYTEGQANRAVVAALRQLAAASPHLTFSHQGDLDLPGIRIYHSLRQRTGIPINAERMNKETYLQHLAHGIALNDNEVADLEREVSLGRLPLQDLLQTMLKNRVRIEQEALA